MQDPPPGLGREQDLEADEEHPEEHLHDQDLSPDDHSQHDSSLKSPLSFKSAPHAQSVHSSTSPDAVCQHHHPNPDYGPHSHQHPPAIHTLDLLYPSDSDDFPPWPILSSTDNSGVSQPTFMRQSPLPQPMSAPCTRTAFLQCFSTESSLASMPFTNPTLDRRMSEPVIGAECPTYMQPSSSQHVTFAHSGASYKTVSQPSPLSLPLSFSYDACTEHQRDRSSPSISSTELLDPYTNLATAWGFGVKQVGFGARSHLTKSPITPLYAGSTTSSDVSATGLPSPPTQMRPSPSKTSTTIPTGGGVKPGHKAPDQATAGTMHSFVSVPGNAIKKRPRRRFEEIERLYQCSWSDCNKAYGTLNHLNQHITMQRHGPKRSPREFKELRKKWRQEKKETEEAEHRCKREAALQEMVMCDMQYQPDHRSASQPQMSMIEPHSHPHGHRASGEPPSIPNHSHVHSAMQGRAASAMQPFRNAGVGADVRYGLPSPAEEVSHFCYPARHRPSQGGLLSLSIPHHNPEEDVYYPQGQIKLQSKLGWGNQHPWQYPQHGIRPPHHQYQSHNTHENVMLPPPHSLNQLSVFKPNPSPLSHGGFPFLGPSKDPGPTLWGDVGLGTAGPGLGLESGSPTPNLATHVLLGSNRLPSDSILLTPLPGYEPDGKDQLDMVGHAWEQPYELKCDKYGHERTWWRRDWEWYYAAKEKRAGE